MSSGEPAPASAWRHARAIVLLPGMVTIAVPALLLLTDESDSSIGPWPLVVLSAILIAGGLGLWVWTVRLLARIGRGTLAPWDPTRRLVVAGPYRHVRNPMISAVAGVLLGEALLFGSTELGIWFAVFLAVNTAYFVLVEEPGLEGRFGDEYREYKRSVPRWLPRR